MTAAGDTPHDERVVAAQMGRNPRGPWRAAARCSFGYPSVIVSPPLLADGTPFPTWAWLTCPHLVDVCAAEESAGAVARWAERLSSDIDLAAQMLAADAALRVARAAEGPDPHPEYGLAGQGDPLATKCVHAHVALALAGIADPVGASVIATFGRECADERCRRLVPGDGEGV